MSLYLLFAISFLWAATPVETRGGLKMLALFLQARQDCLGFGALGEGCF